MLTGSLPLCRLILRRDRLRICLWFLGIAAMVVGYGSAIQEMYPSAAERLAMAETMKNPAMVVMVGPVYDSAGYNTGALYANFMLLWSAMLMGIMNIFFVVRHTRQDEERGRTEVIRSLPVGRLSNLSAVLGTALSMNLVFALLMGLGLGMLGVESIGLAPSLLFGAVLGAAGLFFAAVTAVFCQLCASPRTAQALSFGFLIASYMLRAMGDLQSEAAACLTPLGLLLRTKVFVEDIWWPVAVTLLMAAGAALLAFYCCAIRDMGEGLIPARPGKKDASPRLRSAEALAWRLLHTPFLCWAAVSFILGAAYGSIMGDIEEFISTNEFFKLLFEDADPARFISFLMVITSILGTIPILQFILKARSQESSGFAENILARSVSRYAQLRGYFLIALGAGLLMPLMNGLGFWAGSAPVMENPIALSVYLQASLAYIPAIWAMLGLAMLLIAYLPRCAAFVWAYLGYTFFVLYMQSLLKLPEWTTKLSPYNYIPMLPLEDFEPLEPLLLTAAALVMFALGFVGYRGRDMKLS